LTGSRHAAEETRVREWKMRRVNPNASDKILFSLIIKIHVSPWGGQFKQYFMLGKRPYGFIVGEIPIHATAPDDD